jgi:purine nucleosidase
MRLHIDTDLGGDPDDACALAMVLGWPDVDLVGITTTAEPDGQRAGYVAHVLELVGRTDIPVAAGAERSLTTGQFMGEVPEHARYWGGPRVAPRPGAQSAVTELLERSIDSGATIAAIGPYTNLSLLAAHRPGRLNGARVVAMGGWVHPPAPGLPAWGPEMDWNVQCDTEAALTLVGSADLTLVTMPAPMTAPLREVDLPRLAASGPLGAALARQSAAHGADYAMRELGRAHTGLPDDLVNFHWDEVACAVALGWSGTTMEELTLTPVQVGDVVRFQPGEDGRDIRVVTHVDGEAFAEMWISAVEAAQGHR